MKEIKCAKSLFIDLEKDTESTQRKNRIAFYMKEIKCAKSLFIDLALEKDTESTQLNTEEEHQSHFIESPHNAHTSNMQHPSPPL